jgi:hypothetical protein
MIIHLPSKNEIGFPLNTLFMITYDGGAVTNMTGKTCGFGMARGMCNGSASNTQTAPEHAQTRQPVLRIFK